MAISSVIKYEGDNETFVWKHSEENFNTTTQLIVYESQEAILFRNGQALDLFPPGRHTLETENIPLLRRIVNVPTGGETPFQCSVYFINKVHSMNILWGTRERVLIKDPVYNIILPVGAHGQFAIKVEDSRKLLVKLVGTIKEFNQDTLISYFRGLLSTRIKDYISNQMINEKISFLDIHTHLNKISDAIHGKISGVFANYGISLVNFFISAISVPQDDPSFIQLKAAYAKYAEMGILGYDYQTERTFNVLDNAAKNEGAGGSIIGAGMGLGVGVNLGSTVGNAMEGAMKDITPGQKAQQSIVACSSCTTELPSDAKFCIKCGQQQTANEIICGKCKKPVAKGVFCMHCGAKLSSECPSCKEELPEGAKFCLKCGTKIEG